MPSCKISRFSTLIFFLNSQFWLIHTFSIYGYFNMNEYFITITSRLPPPFLVYFIRGLLTKEKFHLFRPAVIRKTLIFLRSQNGMTQQTAGVQSCPLTNRGLASTLLLHIRPWGVCTPQCPAPMASLHACVLLPPLHSDRPSHATLEQHTSFHSADSAWTTASRNTAWTRPCL